MSDETTTRAFAGLLPQQVAVVARIGDVELDELWPEEAASVARAVHRRQQEFATVRHCARRALLRLGHKPAAILPGPDRAPQWPTGIRGSMTHCPQVRAAALTDDPQIAAVGIDAEVNEPLPAGVLQLVTDDRERTWLADLAVREPEVCWDRLLFSAKEAIFKAWYPLTHRWLGFEECQLELQSDGTGVGVLLVPGPEITVHGIRQQIGRIPIRWTHHQDHLFTACQL